MTLAGVSSCLNTGVLILVSDMIRDSGRNYMKYLYHAVILDNIFKLACNDHSICTIAISRKPSEIYIEYS